MTNDFKKLKQSEINKMFLKACENSDYKLVEKILKTKRIDVNIRDINGESPFCLALKKDTFYPCLIEDLVDYGFDVNILNKNSEYTLLQHFYLYCPFYMVEYLLENGADINRPGYNGNTLLHLYCRNKKINKKLEKLFLKYNVVIDIKNAQDRTAFFEAVIIGSLKKVKFLFNNGSNIYIEDYEGETPLHDCMFKGKKTIVRFLLKKKIDVNVKNVHKEPAFFYIKKLEEAKLFEKYGVDFTIKNDNNETILNRLYSEWYLKELDERLVKFLIKKGVDINYKDNSGWTILHMACFFGIGYSEFLLKNGADFTIKNKEGKTALDYANPIDIKIIKQFKNNEKK